MTRAHHLRGVAEMPLQNMDPIEDTVGGIKDLVGGVVEAGREVVKGAQDTANSVVNIASFASDPAGYIFDLLKIGAKGLAHDVLPALAHATEPDLAADWFLNAYRISFATAIFVWVFLLAFQFYRVAKGSMSSRDLADSLGPQTIQFFAGAIYGPMLGWLVVKFFSALTDVFIGWGVTDAADSTVAAFTKMIDDANPGAIVGGVFVGIFLMFFMILALLMTLGILIVTLVALYFTGVIFPLGWVWIISKGHRRHGRRIVMLWIGILAMHSILFFFLGFTFTMMANATLFGEWSDGLKTLVQLLVAVVAMIGAGYAPYKLMKFAMVIPEGAGGQAGGQLGGGGGGGTTYGADGPAGAREITRNSGGQGDSSPAGGGSGSSSESTGMSWAEPTSERKPLTNALSAMKSSEASGSDAGAAPEAVAGPSGTGGGVAGADGATAGAAAPGAAGAASATAGPSAAGATAGAGGAAAAGTEGAMAVGAAESSTGVGALVGIPTMMAAAGKAAGDKVADVSNTAFDQAIGELEDGAEGYANE